MAGQLKNDNPGHDLTTEEQRKGGIASGKARNYKKEQIENLKMLLDSTNKNGKTYRELINLGLMKGALNGKAENFKALMDYIDDNQQSNDTPTININIVDNSELEKAMYEEN
jgi:hypothetical protein